MGERGSETARERSPRVFFRLPWWVPRHYPSATSAVVCGTHGSPAHRGDRELGVPPPLLSSLAKCCSRRCGWPNPSSRPWVSAEGRTQAKSYGTCSKMWLTGWGNAGMETPQAASAAQDTLRERTPDLLQCIRCCAALRTHGLTSFHLVYVLDRNILSS